MSKPYIRKWYETSVVCAPSGGASLTKQSFKDECDVNQIMARWVSHGVAPPVNRREPVYGDFTDVVEFQEAVQRVRTAEAMFAALPANVRRRCDHDPGKFLEFMGDEANLPEMVELGLIKAVAPAAKPEPEKKTDGGKPPPSEPSEDS